MTSTIKTMYREGFRRFIGRGRSGEDPGEGSGECHMLPPPMAPFDNLTIALTAALEHKWPESVHSPHLADCHDIVRRGANTHAMVLCQYGSIEAQAANTRLRVIVYCSQVSMQLDRARPFVLTPHTSYDTSIVLSRFAVLRLCLTMRH